MDIQPAGPSKTHQEVQRQEDVAVQYNHLPDAEVNRQLAQEKAGRGTWLLERDRKSLCLCGMPRSRLETDS